MDRRETTTTRPSQTPTTITYTRTESVQKTRGVHPFIHHCVGVFFTLTLEKNANVFPLVVQQLETEVDSHQGQINVVMSKAEQLEKGKHFATPTIREKSNELAEEWRQLLGLAKNRRDALDLALKGLSGTLTFINLYNAK